ncbi:MAG: lamin tail domain-containing protein, partial [Verrucomicrobiae bacterium]|nr:lamin tail domain-containing protein [Verrucomicrobiae bacterium]
VLGPGEYRMVWCDGQVEQSAGTNLHTNFRLTGGSGSVALVMPVDGQLGVLDYLNYTNLAPGQSYGDYPNGQMFYRQVFAQATPGRSNAATAVVVQAAEVRINEWMASNTRTLQEPNGLAYEDWFELYNPGNEPVNLAGYYLTDAPNAAPQKFQIPPGYVIPPRGFLLVWADNAPHRNSTNSPELHVNFALSRNGDDIGLFAPDGRLVDLVVFGAQTSDVSQGRFPDGSASIQTLASPTPGRPNVGGQPSQPPVFNLADVRVNGSLINLGFQTTAGKRYQVQYKNRLNDTLWLNFGGPQTATGATLTVQDNILTQPSRFYRVIEVP